MAKKVGIFDDVLKLIDNDYASVAEDGTIADISGYVDTGSYALNALFSGDIYLGIPQNHISAFAGEEATGKTFFALGIIKNFLDTDTNTAVVLFETESAVKKKMLVERGIDTKRILIVPVETVQQFKTQALKIVNNHIENEDKDKPKLMLVLDSLGMLSTTKELEDSESGKGTKDMTRAPEIKAAFRTLTLRLSKANIPLLVTNHVYAQIGQMYPTKELSGGSGLKYSGNNIIFLSRRKEKDSEGDVIGNVIHCKGVKLRDTRENRMVDVLLTYDRGLDRYFGLLDIAIKHEIFKKLDRQIELPDGVKVFETTLMKSPQKYYTKEILDRINAACKKEFLYGSAQPDEVEELDTKE